ncbi:MAG: nucleotide exchange factor GrpE [Planctomycetota bacterium]
MSEDQPREDEEQTLPETEAETVDEFDLTPDGEEPTFEEALETEEGSEAFEDDPPTAEEFAAVRQRAAAAEAARDEFEAKLMRTAADYQNFVRRSELNLQATKQETLMKVAKALVGVMDNFDRALELDPETTTAEDVQKGAASIQSALLQALEGFGLQKISVEPGDEFDPNLHEALMRQPSEEIESNHVAAQFLPGYVLNDQPVRPAQVSVAE